MELASLGNYLLILLNPNRPGSGGRDIDHYKTFRTIEY